MTKPGSINSLNPPDLVPAVAPISVPRLALHLMPIFGHLLLPALVSILFVLAWPQTVSAKSSQPNILFILTDDQRLDDIKHMKSLQSLLVEQGVSFNNYFDNVSLCCPSRTSILRGQFAHNTGVLTNKPPNGGWGVAHERGLESSTIATWLHNRGYYTALIGKYLNGYPGALGPNYIPPGWDYWASSVKGNPYSEYNYSLNENGKIVWYGEKPEDYGTDVYAGKARQVIKECATSGKPFFIYLAFYAPHSPATPAPRHVGLFHDAKVPRSEAFNEKDVSTKPQFIQKLSSLTDEGVQAEDTYYGKRLRSLQAVDEAIENLCETLKENKQLDDTYVVFVSDNGFHLGEHRMRAGKQTAYETDIHLPLIVRGPDVPHGKTVDEIVGNIDLAPTFAAIASAEAPSFVDGRSFLPFLHGDKSEIAWRNRFFVEHDRPGRNAAGNAAGNAGKNAGKNAARTAKEDGVAQKVVSAGATADDGDEPADQVTKTSTMGAEQQAESTAGSQGSDQSASSSPQQLRGRRRRAGPRAALRNFRSELGAIPPYQAVRTHDSSFVHYVTDEKEFYKVVSDPSQLKNLAGDAGDKDSQTELSKELQKIEALKQAAGPEARKLEAMP